MPETHFREIVAFVGFDASDEAALRALHPVARPRFKHIADLFYQRIQASAARSVLRDERQVERLKLSLRGWLDRILSGPWDLEFVELQRRIGQVHVQVQLPQRFMLTAMSVIHLELQRIAEQQHADDVEGRGASLAALAKLLDIVLALMLGSYRDDSIAALRRLGEVERKLIAQELEVSEERCKAVLETAEVMAIAIASNGEIRLFNRQAELVSGYPRTEMHSLDDLARIWHPIEREAADAVLATVRAGKASLVTELRIVNRDRAPRWIRWHVTQLPAASGEGEVCFIGIDLTAERQFAERTRLAETLATMGTLAAGLAHEIRNPLNAAQLQLTLAERRLAREGGVSLVAIDPIRVVREELGRLATLVQDFLAYAGPTPMRPQAVDLAETARSVVELLRPGAADANVELTLDCAGAVTAEADAERMRQVLINLVHNAVDAAGNPGDVVVHVERAGPSTLIEVSDSGPGFTDGMDIFEPFKTSKDTGSGLGLSIVKRIVDDHHGTIGAGRRHNRTVFRIEIPTVSSRA